MSDFKDWFNEDDHDLYNYPDEAMEEAWNEATARAQQENMDERLKSLRLLFNCASKLESQVMRRPSLPKSYYATMKQAFAHIMEVNERFKEQGNDSTN